MLIWFFLVHFARGVCHKGADCEYLHRLPGIHDLYQPNTDCFGRCVDFIPDREDLAGSF